MCRGVVRSHRAVERREGATQINAASINLRGLPLQQVISLRGRVEAEPTIGRWRATDCVVLLARAATHRKASGSPSFTVCALSRARAVLPQDTFLGCPFTGTLSRHHFHVITLLGKANGGAFVSLVLPPYHPHGALRLTLACANQVFCLNGCRHHSTLLTTYFAGSSAHCAD